MKQKIFLIFLTFTINPLFAYVSVDSSFGSNCTYTSIQDAIDSGDSDIRVVNANEYVENITINNSVSIRGGFDSCLSAALNINTGGDNSIIDGSSFAGESTVNIVGFSAINVDIEKMSFKNATSDGHGIDMNNTFGSLTIKESLIIGNSAENGGGLYVGDPSSNLFVIIEQSSIFGNTASANGGGIYCGGSNASIRITQQSLIGENMAEDGGGIAAINGCSITIDSGVDVFNSVDLRGVMDNSASNNGGGVYLDNANLFLQGNIYSFLNYGNNSNPVTVANNNAGSSGGGIYAENQSSVEIIDGLIDSNFSTNNGGGIFLGLDSQLTMKTSNKPCWQERKCSILSNNKTGTTKSGGGIYSASNTVVNLFNTHVYGNRAQFGAVVYVLDFNDAVRPNINLDGNYIYKNGNNGGDGYLDNFMFRFYGFIDVTFVHNTITANDINDSSTIFGLNGAVDLEINNSIIDNQDELILTTEGSGFSVTTNCVAVNENDTISGNPLGIFAVGYVNSNDDDYRLATQSFLIDSCADAGGLLADSENDARGWDDPTISNLSGTYDAGADESYLSDIIFNNGFE